MVMRLHDKTQFFIGIMKWNAEHGYPCPGHVETKAKNKRSLKVLQLLMVAPAKNQMIVKSTATVTYIRREARKLLQSYYITYIPQR